jgi:hypothetical protein
VAQSCAALPWRRRIDNPAMVRLARAMCPLLRPVIGRCVFVVAGLSGAAAVAAELPEGVRRGRVLNYPDCLELFNTHTTVVLGHHVGGRVLSYSWQGREALFLDPAEADWETPAARKRPLVTAGRFDLGPEHLAPRREVLWSGPWSAEAIGPRAARLTSAPDPATGVQLIREFRLAADSSHLACTQIMRNISGQTRRWCHWSRTFARHGGIAVVPLTPERTKFPNHYVMYTPGPAPAIGFRPQDPRIRIRDGFVEVLGVPAQPKLGFDSFAGWFAYQMPHDLLFVKRFAVYPDAFYNEIAGLTISIYYPAAERLRAVELEPIGPRQEIAPGAEAAFTEHWWLLDHPFPRAGADLDLAALAARVAAGTGTVPGGGRDGR